ncbi:MAG: DUF2484 family protein [Marinosulfonomonas sp.]|nr:DUF2484 family protein [Marinosulfonomonas sp.]
MKFSLIAGAFWVIAATITALLPMRRQMAPGLVLLVLAPVLLIYIGYETSWWVTGLALAAFLSMFRNPLRALVKWMMGKPIEIPKEIQEQLNKGQKK